MNPTGPIGGQHAGSGQFWAGFGGLTDWGGTLLHSIGVDTGLWAQGCESTLAAQQIGAEFKRNLRAPVPSKFEGFTMKVTPRLLRVTLTGTDWVSHTKFRISTTGKRLEDAPLNVSVSLKFTTIFTDMWAYPATAKFLLINCATVTKPIQIKGKISAPAMNCKGYGCAETRPDLLKFLMPSEWNNPTIGWIQSFRSEMLATWWVRAIPYLGLLSPGICYCHFWLNMFYSWLNQSLFLLVEKILSFVCLKRSFPGYGTAHSWAKPDRGSCHLTRQLLFRMRPCSTQSRSSAPYLRRELPWGGKKVASQSVMRTCHPNFQKGRLRQWNHWGLGRANAEMCFIVT